MALARPGITRTHALLPCSLLCPALLFAACARRLTLARLPSAGCGPAPLAAPEREAGGGRPHELGSPPGHGGGARRGAEVRGRGRTGACALHARSTARVCRDAEGVMSRGATPQVSFVFVCKVEGKDVTDEPPISAAQSAAQRGGAAGPSTMRAPGARGGPPAGGGGAGPRPALAPLQSKAPAPAPRPVPAAAHQAAAPKVAPARTPVPARRPDLAPAGAPASRPSPAAAAAPPVVKRIHQPSGGASAPPHPPRAATPVLISVPDSDVEMEEEEQQVPATLAASELVRSEGASAKRPKHDAPTLSPLARPVSDQAPVAVFVKKSRLQSASSGGRAVPVAAAPLVAVPPGAPANFYTPARDEDDDFVA